MKHLAQILFFVGWMSSWPLFAQQLDYGSTNSFGMEFQKIEPGRLLMGRLEIECPSYPDTRDVPEELKWTKEDFEKCKELT